MISIIFRYLGTAIVGFLAGSAFAMSLTIGIAFLVGNAFMSPRLSGNDMEVVLDYIAGPSALVFALIGIIDGIMRVNRQVALEARGATAMNPVGPVGGASMTGLALALVVTIGLAALAWPLLIATLTSRGIDEGVLAGVIGIPVVVGIIIFVAWQMLKGRKASAPSTGARAAVRRTSPVLVAVAIGSSTLLGAGTLSAVAEWHQILFVLIGIPLSAAMFVGHLLSCIWFFRPYPPRVAQ